MAWTDEELQHLKSMVDEDGELSTSLKIVPVDVHEDGLLWLINVSVFHPRGYSLGFNPETHQFFLMGDGTEEWPLLSSDDSDNSDTIDSKIFFARAKALMP